MEEVKAASLIVEDGFHPESKHGNKVRKHLPVFEGDSKSELAA